MDAYDADVLIYASDHDNPAGEPIRTHVEGLLAADAPVIGVGSTTLLPELMAKPLREGNEAELATLAEILVRLELVPCDEAVAHLAVDLCARHRLDTVDAIHLASAIQAGARRFITNNRRDFDKSIAESERITIAYPEDLAAGNEFGA